MKKLSYFLLLLAIGHESIAQQSDHVACIVIDKPYHAAGEFLAYTLYNLEVESNYLSRQVTIANIDLIHPYGVNVLTQVTQLTGGRASGVLVLPDTLSGGIYKLSAEISGRSFIREVVIDGPSKLNVPVKGKMKMSLSPEGGKLISGISGWTGVKLTDSFGLPGGIATEGVVKKTDGEIVTRFQINEKGFGKFQLLPLDGQHYTVEVTVYGQRYTQPLPVTQQGFALSAIQSEDTIRISIKSSPEWYDRKFNLKMLARGAVNLTTSGSVRSPAGFRIKIPASTVLQGVHEIQLIEDNSVYSKRAIFVPVGQRVKIDMEMSKQVFSTREAGSVKIKLKDQHNQPLASRFTATLYENKYAAPYTSFQQALLSNAYSSHVLGVSQDQFFEDEMLNFYSENVPLLPAPPGRQGFINVLEGQVNDHDSGTPLKNKFVIVSVISPLNPHPILLFKETDAHGNFKVVLPPVNGNLTVFVKVKDVGENTSGVQFIMKHRSSDEKSNTQADVKSNARFELGNADGYYKTFRENQAIAQSYSTLPMQVVEDGKDAFDSYTLRNFTSHYNLNEYHVPATLKEVIVDIMDGVVVRKRKGRDELRLVQRDIYNKRTNPLFKAQPLMLVDGIPVMDPAVLFAIPPGEILTIEMNHDSLYFGNLVVNGIFSVSTRTKQFHYRSDPNQYTYSAVSLQSPVGFKFPEYAQPVQQSKQLPRSETPDFRSLLFYQPLAETDPAGEALLHFSTSDDQGEYVLRIEGITESGIPFHHTQVIEVKKR